MERENERLARKIVQDALGVEVVRFEDGRVPSQVDALIHTASGPAALEIVAQHDSAFNAQWSALGRCNHEVRVPNLRRRWVALLAHGASVKRVIAQLPRLMTEIEASWPEGRRRSNRPDVLDSLSKLGIISLAPLELGGAPGVVRLWSEGWSGVARADPVAGFVEEVLAAETDVAEKLRAHPAVEKHAFIWATVGSDFSVQYALERRRAWKLPGTAPNLPEGVTPVWVAGSLESQGVVAWSPALGWWRPGLQTSDA